MKERHSKGEYDIHWDASKFSSGVYYYQIIADDIQKVKKCLLIK